MTYADDDLITQSTESEAPEGRRRQRPGRGPRTGGNGGGSPLQQPRIRLLIALGLLVVIILILVSTIRGCQRDKLVDNYRTYLSTANQIADESTEQGKQLNALLENKDFKKRAQIRPEVEALAAKAQELVGRAKDLNPPGRLEGPNNTFITALEYRALGLSQLPTAIDAAVTGKDKANAQTTLATPLQVLAAGDVIYRTSYSGPTQNALQEDDIKDVQVNPSEFFNGALYNRTSPVGARVIIENLRRIRPSTGTATDGSTDGQVHGLSLVSTFAVNGADRRQLTPGATVALTQSADLKFEVTVENGGDFVENGIDVTFTYIAKDNPQGTAETKTIEQIEPGEDSQQRLEFTLPTQPNFDGTSTIKVEVALVQDEKSADNNVKEYPIEFNFQ